MSQQTIILAPNAQQAESLKGRFFTVISSTAAFKVDLGDGNFRVVHSYSRIGGAQFRRIVFLETSGLANTIVFDAGDEEYQGDTQAQVSNAPVRALGNLGKSVSTIATGGLPAIDASGWMSVTNGMGLLISGTYLGGRRKRIVITVASTTVIPGNSALTVSVVAAATVFMIIQAGQTITLDEDCDFYMSGAGGTCKCTVGQTFYNA